MSKQNDLHLLMHGSRRSHCQFDAQTPSVYKSRLGTKKETQQINELAFPHFADTYSTHILQAIHLHSWMFY